MNRPLSTKLSQTVTRYRLAIIIAYTIMVAISLLVISGRLMSDQAMVDNSISVWFQKNDTDLAEFHSFQQSFGSEEWSSVIIKTENIYDKAFLNELRKVTEDIEALDVVVRATSIANVRVNRMVDNDELWFAPILEGDKSEQWQQPNTLKDYKDRLNNNKFVNNLLHHTDDDQHTLIVIQSEDRSDDPGAYRRDYYDAIYAILENRKSFLAVGFQGNSPLIVELNRSSMRDVYIFYTTSVLLLFILGLLVFRNLKDALILLAMALGVLVPAMACIAAADIPYNMMTQIMPVLLIAIATANVVHLIKEFHRNRLRMSNEEAIQTAISMLWVAGGWAAATTLVGFASFIISEVRPVSQLGLFGSIGILLGWILSLTAAPAFLFYLYEGLPPLSTDAASNSETYMERVPDFIARHKKKIFALFALLSMTLIGIVNLQVGSNFAKFIGLNTATRSAFDFAQAQSFTASAVHLSVTFDNTSLTAGQDNFTKLLQLEHKLDILAQQRPDFHTVLGPGKMLWEVEKALSDARTTRQSFSAFSGGELNDLIFTAQLSGNDQLADYLSEDKTQVRIALLTDYMDSQVLHQFRQEVQALVHSVAINDSKFIFTGNQVLLANMDAHVLDTQIDTLAIVGLFLLVLLPPLFKSIGLGLLGVVFNLFPLVFIYSLMSWLNIPINLATVIIGGVALSLVVDDTIHFLVRFKQYQNRGYGWDQAVDETLATIGHSITLTSIILIATFSIMILSDFLPIRYFGIFISATVFIAWAMDLFLLPLLLKLYGRAFVTEQVATHLKHTTLEQNYSALAYDKPQVSLKRKEK